jgi:hypothetical protein
VVRLSGDYSLLGPGQPQLSYQFFLRGPASVKLADPPRFGTFLVQDP